MCTAPCRYGGGPAVNHLYVCHTCQIEIEKLEKRRKSELDMFVRVSLSTIRSLWSFSQRQGNICVSDNALGVSQWAQYPGECVGLFSSLLNQLIGCMCWCSSPRQEMRGVSPMKALSLMHWDRCSCYCLLRLLTHTMAAQKGEIDFVCVYERESFSER